MSRTLEQITIFISGTTEADSEKAALRKVAEEMNRRLEKTHALTLRVIAWPDDVRPGVNVDPQAEISRQFGPSPDIYVGLLGTRFGTPTPRAGSGTEEEFNDALRRFHADSRSIRVLFYFKRTAGDSFAIDLDQFHKVRVFRDKLPALGVLSRDFKDTADFVRLVQDHLYNLIVDEWQQTHWTPILADRVASEARTLTGEETALAADHTDTSCANAVSVTAGPTIDGLTDVTNEEDLGWLDHVAELYESVSAVTEAMNGLAHNTERMTEQILTRTQEVEALKQKYERLKHIGGSRAQQEFVALARQTVDEAASNLDEYVNALTPNIEQYRSNIRRLFAHLRNTLKAGGELAEARGDENRNTLLGLVDVFQVAREQTGTFQASMNQVPALTGKFKRARRHVALGLGELIAELSFSIDEARRLLAEMDGTTTSGPL